jgi:uncharacterized membrane protein YphA (DoxX/SURF4 family)
MQRFVGIGLWVCQAALALMFVFAGIAKFTSPMWPRMFARWGYPDHFYLVIGTVEVAAALALLVPRLAAPASLVLLVVMSGAGLTHLVHDELRRLQEIFVISAVLGIVAYGRWKEAMWGQKRPTPA